MRRCHCIPLAKLPHTLATAHTTGLRWHALDSKQYTYDATACKLTQPTSLAPATVSTGSALPQTGKYVPQTGKCLHTADVTTIVVTIAESAIVHGISADILSVTHSYGIPICNKMLPTGRICYQMTITTLWLSGIMQSGSANVVANDRDAQQS